jgi:hypothetical protein
MPVDAEVHMPPGAAFESCVVLPTVTAVMPPIAGTTGIAFTVTVTGLAAEVQPLAPVAATPNVPALVVLIDEVVALFVQRMLSVETVDNTV